MPTQPSLPDPSVPSPFPSDAELQRSQRKIKAEGGRLVSGPHRGVSIRYEDTTVSDEKTTPKIARLGPKRNKVTTVETSGCGHMANVEIPHYHGDGSRHWTKACLICDGLFLSPNFSGLLEDQ